MPSANIIFETCLLDKNFERDEFDCGHEGLNTYLKTYASQDHKRGLARVFVLVDQQNFIQGYYTLSAGNVSFEHLPLNISKRIPKYPIPIALIGRLAINGAYQKKGLGSYLLIDAFKRIIDVNKQLAIFAVIVDAKDEAARRFYKRHDFLSFQHEELKKNKRSLPHLGWSLSPTINSQAFRVWSGFLRCGENPWESCLLLRLKLDLNNQLLSF